MSKSNPVVISMTVLTASKPYKHKEAKSKVTVPVSGCVLQNRTHAVACSVWYKVQ